MNPYPSPIHSLLALLLLIAGGVLIAGSKLGVALGTDHGSAGTILLVSLLGAVLWLWGCFHLAIASKLNPAFGMLGVFFLIGVFIILWCAKKQPEWERAAARQRARNPKKEYRGDPDSPY